MLSQLLEKLQINTLRTKLISAFLFVGLVPFMIFAVFSYNTYSGALHDKITNYSEEVVVRMQTQLDDYFQDVSTLLDMKNDYYINQSIKLIQTHEYTGNRKYIFRMWEDFNNIRKLKRGLKEFSLTFPDGQRLSNYGLYYVNNELDLFAAIEDNSQTPVVTGPHRNFYGEEVVTVAKLFNNREINKRVVISAAVDLDILREITDVRLGRNGYVFIVNEKGKLIYLPPGKKAAEISGMYSGQVRNSETGNLLYNTHDGDYILTYATSEVTGWKIISVVSAGQATAELVKLKRLTFIIVGIILASIILLIIYLSAFLTRPIRELEAVTKVAANNNLDVDITTRGNDEIAKLSKSFNKMLSRIRELVKENIAEQKQIRNLEMKTLHEQIKPHFIYNTLDLIIGYLEKKNKSKATYLIESLGKFFRLSFAKGREMVRIKEEIEHVKNYLFIQQERFGDRFEFIVDIKDEEIFQYYIPKLLLQPLVENAIYHGVLEVNKKGLIIIRGYCREGKIIIEVIDNGKGIAATRLEEINRVLRNEERATEKDGFFGLRNVNKRIKYKFGEEYGLYVESRPEVKTISRVVIGMLKGEEEDV